MRRIVALLGVSTVLFLAIGCMGGTRNIGVPRVIDSWGIGIRKIVDENLVDPASSADIIAFNAVLDILIEEFPDNPYNFRVDSLYSFKLVGRVSDDQGRLYELARTLVEFAPVAVLGDLDLKVVPLRSLWVVEEYSREHIQIVIERLTCYMLEDPPLLRSGDLIAKVLLRLASNDTIIGSIILSFDDQGSPYEFLFTYIPREFIDEELPEEILSCKLP